jgi:hypothetical protein
MNYGQTPALEFSSFNDLRTYDKPIDEGFKITLDMDYFMKATISPNAEMRDSHFWITQSDLLETQKGKSRFSYGV